MRWEKCWVLKLSLVKNLYVVSKSCFLGILYFTIAQQSTEEELLPNCFISFSSQDLFLNFMITERISREKIWLCHHRYVKFQHFFLTPVPNITDTFIKQNRGIVSHSTETQTRKKNSSFALAKILSTPKPKLPTCATLSDDRPS